jgi:hypothetical protein
MLEKIKKPYKVSVSVKALAAGLKDSTFPNKKAALGYVKRVRAIDPEFNQAFHVIFKYVDTATGAFYVNRTEYDLEQERCRIWLKQRGAANEIVTKPPN